MPRRCCKTRPHSAAQQNRILFASHNQASRWHRKSHHGRRQLPPHQPSHSITRTIPSVPEAGRRPPPGNARSSSSSPHLTSATGPVQPPYEPSPALMGALRERERERERKGDRERERARVSTALAALIARVAAPPPSSASSQGQKQQGACAFYGQLHASFGPLSEASRRWLLPTMRMVHLC
ncbi:hypothetical protein MSAN_02473500 [Mycena sanguinolenta]|uniref:Uncharacterized protein n=1 Tax=Mycena sanguinolenta TaxID=230812 RepID=A0A8H6WRV6_9AGAR|nr:hypothetical protein MSAN_02473500 [Mycena sanguinolenta]